MWQNAFFVFFPKLVQFANVSCVSQTVSEEAGDWPAGRGILIWTAGCSASCHCTRLVGHIQTDTCYFLCVREQTQWLKGNSSCRYCGRTDCGCTYQMTVCLLDENHEVIQEFRPDSVTLDPDCDDCSWKQVFKSPFNSKKSDSYKCVTNTVLCILHYSSQWFSVCTAG